MNEGIEIRDDFIPLSPLTRSGIFDRRRRIRKAGRVGIKALSPATLLGSNRVTL
jgi:hypothetical protein